MNRKEFIEQLTTNLSGLPIEEKEAAISYYEEFFDDAGPLNEEKVIDELGSPKIIAESIMRDSTINEQRDIISLKKSYNSDADNTSNANNTQNTNSGYDYNNQKSNTNTSKYKDTSAIAIIVILLVLSSPFWLSVLSAVFSVLMTVIIVAVCIICVMGILGAVSIIFGIISLFTSPPVGLALFGIGLVSIGITILLFIPTIHFCIWIVKGTVKLCKSLWVGLFERKGVA